MISRKSLSNANLRTSQGLRIELSPEKHATASVTMSAILQVHVSPELLKLRQLGESTCCDFCIVTNDSSRKPGTFQGAGSKDVLSTTLLISVASDG